MLLTRETMLYIQRFNNGNWDLVTDKICLVKDINSLLPPISLHEASNQNIDM